MNEACMVAQAWPKIGDDNHDHQPTLRPINFAGLTYGDEDDTEQTEFSSRDPKAMTSHALIIRFDDYARRFPAQSGGDLQPLVLLADYLDGILTAHGLGELDGHEIADDGSVGTIYLYGENARAMYAVVKDTLEASPITRGGMAFLYYGDVTDEATKVEEIPIDGQVS